MYADRLEFSFMATDTSSYYGNRYTQTTLRPMSGTGATVHIPPYAEPLENATPYKTTVPGINGGQAHATVWIRMILGGS